MFPQSLWGGALLCRQQSPQAIFERTSWRNRQFHAGRRQLLQNLRVMGFLGEPPSDWLERRQRPPLPDGYLGSAAHCPGGLATLVVKDRGCIASVGVDIELSRRFHPALARRVLSTPEFDRFEHLPERTAIGLLARTFVLKEALYKALSPLGIELGFREVTVLSEGFDLATEAPLAGFAIRSWFREWKSLHVGAVKVVRGC